MGSLVTTFSFDYSDFCLIFIFYNWLNIFLRIYTGPKLYTLSYSQNMREDTNTYG